MKGDSRAIWIVVAVVLVLVLLGITVLFGDRFLDFSTQNIDKVTNLGESAVQGE